MDQPTWDLRSVPTEKLLDMLHEYSQAHAHVSDTKSYSHPDSGHYSAHFYNMRWSVARELENRGYKPHILPLVAKSISDTEFLRMDRPPVDMVYILAKGLGEGERWITVHPHGDNEPGVPVLIKERPDGSAHIIGGAGGSLNFVKLTNLKSPEEYRAHAKKKAAEKRQAEKERLEGLSPEQREQERTQKNAVDENKRAQEDAEVAKVYKMMGMEAPQYQDPEELAEKNGVSVTAAKMALNRERQAHISAVRQLAGALRETLIDDHEAAAEAGLGDISLKGASDSALWGTGKQSIEMLQPNKAVETSGIKSDFSGRAAGAGATGESVKAESNLIRERASKGQDEKQRSFSERISANIQQWNEQAKQLEETGQVKQNILKIGELPEAGKMLDILKADRAISQAAANAKKFKGEVKRGLQHNPYIVDTKDISDESINKQFSNEVELKAVRAMLSRVDDEDGLTRHFRNAAFDMLNQVGLTLSGSELMGREVVDFLGSAGAAQLMAQRLRNTLSDEEFDTVATAVSEMHGRDNASIASEAMKSADEEMEKAKQLESGEAEEAMDVVAARALNEQRMEHITNAREILGDAYGRLAAMGELSLAMKGATKGDKEITCDMGGVPREQAILMARSFGLNPEVSQEEADAAGSDAAKVGYVGEGDYRIESGAGKTYITLKPSALSKVVSAFDPEDTKHYEAAQKIKQGEQDEEGWLPAGIERRPASTFDAPGYELSRFDSKLDLAGGANMRESLEDYIGAKVGEGYPLDRLKGDMHSAEFMSTFVPEGKQGEFEGHLAELFPKLDRSDLTPAEFQAKKEELDQQATQQAQAFSEGYKRRRGLTDDLVSLHSQQLPVREAPEQFSEAAHRTLSAMPESKVAFTPMGDLQHEDKETLRNYYLKEFGTQKPKSAQEEELTRRQAERDAAKPKEEPKPEPQTESMFGDDEIDQNAGIKLDEGTQAKLKEQGTSAEAIQAENKQKVAEQRAAEGETGPEKAPETRTPEQAAWDNYVKAMGGQQQAYETIQGIIRGKAVEEFAGHYGKVFGRPLKVGRQEIPNWDKHILGQLPEGKLEEVLGDRAAEARSHMATLAKRSGGKFAKENAEGDRRKAYDSLQAIMKEHQGKLFMEDQFPSIDRPTIGQDAEKQLASVWGNAAQNFSAKKGAIKLMPDLSMDGDKAKQQRAVKLAVQNRRLGLHMGAGSGKSLMSIGTFTEMHDKGMAKKAVFAVPSVVQGQFGSEMLRFTTPGKYNWLSDPKATREERMAAYKDDTTHMIVATHQAFRDDLIHAMAEHSGKSPKDVQRALTGMPEAARNAAMKDAMTALGWKVDFLGVDESQGILNRQGKPDSSSAAAIDAFSAHMPNMLHMTGTPVKNDASEAFDVLKKIHPERFTDRASFMRKYGSNTPTNWASLQRLMARYVYADRISSGVERFTDVNNVKLHPEQQKQYSAVMSALNKVRRSRRTGKADIEAVKALAPDAFEGVPEENHQRVANEVATVGLGGRLNARLLNIVNGETYENNAKIDAMREDLQRDKDKPHVIFAHHYKSIGHIKKLCGELGMKVGVISGDMSAADKARVRRGFQPEDGEEARYDVLLNTDAGSTGQNLQRGTVLMNYDTPDTAMTHEQRAARIDRLGQTSDVTVRDYVTDTPIERKARKRLNTKYALADVFQSPSEMLDDTGLAAEIQRVRAEKGNTPQRQEHPQEQAAQGPSDNDSVLSQQAEAAKRRGGKSPRRPNPPDGLHQWAREQGKQAAQGPEPEAAAEPKAEAAPAKKPIMSLDTPSLKYEEPSEEEKTANRAKLAADKAKRRKSKGDREVAMGYGSINSSKAAGMFEDTDEVREARNKKIDAMYGAPVPFKDKEPEEFTGPIEKPKKGPKLMVPTKPLNDRQHAMLAHIHAQGGTATKERTPDGKKLDFRTMTALRNQGYLEYGPNSTHTLTDKAHQHLSEQPATPAPEPEPEKPLKGRGAKISRALKQNAVNARQKPPSYSVNKMKNGHNVVKYRHPEGGYDVENPVSVHQDEKEAYAEMDRLNKEAGDKPLPFA
jgi:hypothetical protein